MDSDIKRKKDEGRTTKPKPLGVILIMAYLLSIAVGSLVGAYYFGVIIGKPASPSGNWGFDPALFYTFMYLLDQLRVSRAQLWALFFLLLSALFFASAYGLIEMKKWGRIITIICALLQTATALCILPLALLHLFTPTLILILYMPASYPSLGLFGGISALIIGLIILVYLLGDIKHEFK
ncbi:MAG: hypothetical protein ACTSSA_10280 [Candidatus Freyarchaeota archaeon]